jgi:hypothetical protein
VDAFGKRRHFFHQSIPIQRHQRQIVMRIGGGAAMTVAFVEIPVLG